MVGFMTKYVIMAPALGVDMLKQEFDLLVKVNGYKGRAIQAARLVLVDGHTQFEAAKSCNCNQSAVSRAISRVGQAYERFYGGSDE